MIEIKTNEDMERFLTATGHFHDGLIRECGLVARGFVDSELWMHGDVEPFDATVFIQTQFDDLAGIEIHFERVSRFRLDEPFDLQPNGILSNGTIHFSFHYWHTGEPEVIATALRYRLLGPEVLGSAPFLVRAPWTVD